MRGLYLLLLSCLSVVTLNAQTFKFYYQDVEFQNEIQIVAQEADVRTDYFDIENVSANDVTFRIQIVKTVLAEKATLQMCVGGQCNDDTISKELTLEAGKIMKDEFDLSYVCDEDVASTVIVNLLGSDDAVLQSFTVKYVLENNLVNAAQKEKSIALSAVARPNPAASSTTFNYSVPAQYKNTQLIIRNALGSTVKTLPVKSGVAGKLTFNTNELANGVYFYSIVADGRQLITKKLIVKH